MDLDIPPIEWDKIDWSRIHNHSLEEWDKGLDILACSFKMIEETKTKDIQDLRLLAAIPLAYQVLEAARQKVQEQEQAKERLTIRHQKILKRQKQSQEDKP